MRDRGKPFVLYRRGPMSFTIVPRGVKGWLQFAVWLALLAPLAVWFVNHTGPSVSAQDFRSAVAVLIVGLVLWSIGGIWWMTARADVIDPEEMRRDRERRRRRRQRARVQNHAATTTVQADQQDDRSPTP